ncbi:MAG: translation initiation factor IF-2 [Syntrophaceae bacterium]|nr:translation initiation factor IF-2 [Syntrophaceae bacterium]
MSKKRVYELAKELGLDNKELISRLEKIGVIVKSHSSTLEEADLERIQRELLAPEPREMVEQRIKSTVIRRRAIRTAADEEKPGEAEEAPAEAAAEEEPAVPAPEPPETEQPVDAVSVVSPPEPFAQEAEPAAEPVPVAAETAAPPEEEKQPEKPPEVPSRGTTATVISRPAPGEVRKPFVRRETVPSRPSPAAPGARKEVPRRPDLKVTRDVPPAAPAAGAAADKKPKWVADKKKKTIEVVMGEQPGLKKKTLARKSTDRRDIRQELEIDERASRWREEKRATVVRMQKPQITVPKASKRRIKVMEAITVGELAKKMGVKASEVINKLIGLGLMAGINQSIDFDTAVLIAGDFGYQVEAAAFDYDETIQRPETASENLKPRAPVVTIMGHVDHGKTSLLDAIRQTNVIEGEAGGITQAIGAYHVHIKDRDIVFLDTPGHEAFTAMRARGAQVTDIVVLVVAADDGVMEQTVEAINHARSAGVPIMVAINKIDKPNADIGRIKQGLTEYNLVSEEWGGDTIFSEVSAKKQEGIEELLEMILLQADVLELKADPDQPARGIIIESTLDRGRGPVATVLIQEGTLKEGDTFVSRTEFGRVRAMIDDQGRRVKEAPPSMPVVVIGFSGVPQVGAEFVGVEDEKKAKGISEYWIRKERERELSSTSKITLEQLYQRMKEGVKELNVILKADVQGSVEALSDALNKLSTEEIKVKIIHSSTGTVTETDVMLASASNAIIIGFNVRPDARVSELAENEGVEIKPYDIIYNVIADMRAAMEGLLEPEYRDVVQGHAEVRQLFKIPKAGTIAGSYVVDGKISRNAQLRLLRQGVVLYDGRFASLKRLKDDVKEVQTGYECGIGIENFNDLREGDVIEAYVKERVERKL